MKARILIGAICFLLGAGSYYIYDNNFSLSSKIEKCADARMPEAKNKKKFTELDRQNKLSVREYRENYWEYCEDQAKKYPEFFKSRY